MVHGIDAGLLLFSSLLSDHIAGLETIRQTAKDPKEADDCLFDLRTAHGLSRELENPSDALILFDVRKLIFLLHVYMLEAKIKYYETIELRSALERATDFCRSALMMQTSQSLVTLLDRSNCRGSGLILKIIGELSALYDTFILVADDESDFEWSSMSFSNSHSDYIQ